MPDCNDCDTKGSHCQAETTKGSDKQTVKQPIDELSAFIGNAERCRDLRIRRCKFDDQEIAELKRGKLAVAVRDVQKGVSDFLTADKTWMPEVNASRSSGRSGRGDFGLLHEQIHWARVAVEHLQSDLGRAEIVLEQWDNERFWAGRIANGDGHDDGDDNNDETLDDLWDEESSSEGVVDCENDLEEGVVAQEGSTKDAVTGLDSVQSAVNITLDPPKSLKFGVEEISTVNKRLNELFRMLPDPKLEAQQYHDTMEYHKLAKLRENLSKRRQDCESERIRYCKLLEEFEAAYDRARMRNNLAFLRLITKADIQVKSVEALEDDLVSRSIKIIEEFIETMFDSLEAVETDLEYMLSKLKRIKWRLSTLIVPGALAQHSKTLSDAEQKLSEFTEKDAQSWILRLRESEMNAVHGRWPYAAGERAQVLEGFNGFGFTIERLRGEIKKVQEELRG